ncbi:hypothetical protein [Stackebrandtia soli]|uniref:hypothetical protein n=1 Tax=Stackebrandtia soli TaxID=1892856 RepID=UPI0039EBEAD8
MAADGGKTVRRVPPAFLWTMGVVGSAFFGLFGISALTTETGLNRWSMLVGIVGWFLVFYCGVTGPKLRLDRDTLTFVSYTKSVTVPYEAVADVQGMPGWLAITLTTGEALRFSLRAGAQPSAPVSSDRADAVAEDVRQRIADARPTGAPIERHRVHWGAFAVLGIVLTIAGMAGMRM